MIAKTSISKELEDYIEIRDGEIFIDWERLSSLKRKVPCGEIDLETFQLTFDKVLEYLLKQEVLTFGRDNTWRHFIEIPNFQLVLRN